MPGPRRLWARLRRRGTAPSCTSAANSPCRRPRGRSGSARRGWPSASCTTTRRQRSPRPSHRRASPADTWLRSPQPSSPSPLWRAKMSCNASGSFARRCPNRPRSRGGISRGPLPKRRPTLGCNARLSGQAVAAKEPCCRGEGAPSSAAVPKFWALPRPKNSAPARDNSCLGAAASTARQHLCPRRRWHLTPGPSRRRGGPPQSRPRARGPSHGRARRARGRASPPRPAACAWQSLCCRDRHRS
mmetsp:Transcript_77890/g.202854  ORF Transcript_77890/g.202854 Transcript_77890/m.202854 type:complete len:244 (-) Transcript_77890:181-912(-)